MGDLPLAEAANKLEDLSGIVIKPGDNPYTAFIEACHDDCVSPSTPFFSFFSETTRLIKQ